MESVTWVPVLIDGWIGWLKQAVRCGKYCHSDPPGMVILPTNVFPLLLAIPI